MKPSTTTDASARMHAKPFFKAVPSPALVAHRGGAALAPENTLPAFRAAVESWRADQLELDVRLSRDGVPMVFHDDELDRTTDGKGPLSSYTREELGRIDAGYHFSLDGGRTFPFRGTGVAIPTLEEVLAAFPTPVMMELKEATPECRRVVIDLLRARGAVERVCLGAVADADALALAAELPEGCLFFPERAAQRFLSGVLGGGPIDAGPFDVLALPLDALGPDPALGALVAAAHAHGLRLQVWTVNDPGEMRRCLRLGLDGVITDRPDELRHAMDEANARP